MVDDNGNVVVDFGSGVGVLNFGGGVDPKTGRIRRAVVAHKRIDAEGKSVTWYWADGSVNVVSLARFSEAIQLAYALHGLSQKLGDSYASCDGLEDSKTAMLELLDQLEGGDWEKKREGGAKESGGLLARACAEVFGISIDEAKAVIEKLTPKEKKALEVDDKIAAAILKLKRASVGGGVDFGKLFGGSAE